MDNLLTPGKIQRLINLAEDRSFTSSERVLLTDHDLSRMLGPSAVMRSPTYETSSGILDIDRMEAFGESTASTSMNKSAAFNPGEMTGRSTGATETSSCLMPSTSDTYGSTLGGFISRMQQQTNDVNDVLRHSLASNYSFHSKRDLTADEASLISREAPLPVPNNPNLTSYIDNLSINSSMGAYFKNKCQSFGKLLEHSDSPDNTNFTGNMNILNSTNTMPSISEVSSSMPYEVNTDPKSVIVVDDTLDTVPVRQPAKIPPPKSPRRSKLPLSTTYELSKQSAKKYGNDNPPKIPEKPKFNHDLNPTVITSHKSFMCSSKPADVVLRNLHSSFVPVTDDHGPNDTDSLETSVSISKIADYLGRQSELSITEVMNLNKKKPVKDIPMPPQRKEDDEEMKVTYLEDTRQMGATSTLTASSLTTVLDKLNIDIPNVIVTEPTLQHEIIDDYEEPVKRSKSPSKSPTTLSTVRDCSSFRSRSSGESPNNSKGKPKISMLPSSKVLYKELDKSIDWQDVLQQKPIRCRSQARMSIECAREILADIVPHDVEGFVGVSCLASISVTTHTDSWLTAILKFDDLPNSADLNIDVSRVPILLSPGKCEKFSFQITANVETAKYLPFTVILKDSSVDEVVEQKSELRMKFVAPWIQAKSIDGNELVIFPALHETSTFTKSIILQSDCPVELVLKLSIAEGDSIFAIKSVHEIDRSDVDKALSESPSEEYTSKKSRSKNMSLQLCRLTPGKALRVVVAYVAPVLQHLNIPADTEATFYGLLKVNLITNNIMLTKIKLVGSVGVAALVAHVQEDSLHLTKEPTTITLSNSGTALGLWILKFVYSDNALPFKISPSRFEIPPGGSRTITMVYTGHPDAFVHATLKFKEATSGHTATFDITGGSKPKQFPIKTNHNILSWVRHGRKEISLKNNTDRRVHIQCNITGGDGFYMDMTEQTDCLVLSFDPQQCINLSVVFRTSTSVPCKAVLQLIDRAGSTRKIKFFGCNSDESVRWSGGIMTYESTALKQAPPRAPVDLELYNKAHMPAFLVATVKFHLQYLTVEATSRLAGSPKVIAGRARHTITLHVDWNKVDKHRRESATTATSLATVTILTGAECTRRRILKILKEESVSGEPDLSLLPDYLQVLAGQFEGEDPNVDHLFEDFDETKASLTELMSGLHELTAHIELPHDIGLENTIIICDDTMINHHTLAE